MPVKPGWTSLGHPDLYLGQVNLRKWQEVHRHSLRGVFYPIELRARKGHEGSESSSRTEILFALRWRGREWRRLGGTPQSRNAHMRKREKIQIRETVKSLSSSTLETESGDPQQLFALLGGGTMNKSLRSPGLMFPFNAKGRGLPHFLF